MLQLQCHHPTLSFLIAHLEVGATGTPHYQGYLELDRHRRRAHVAKMLPTAWIAKRQGTAREALTYCLKEATEQEQQLLTEQGADYTSACDSSTELPRIITTSTEDGKLKQMLSESTSSKQDVHQRLLNLKAAIDQNKTDTDLANMDFPLFIKHYRGLSHYRMITAPKRDHPVEVIVIQGPTGTGKSKWSMDTYPDAYWKQRSQWWDNYEQQETVIIDEFYGWLPFDNLLRLCDRYPLLVETKGGQINFNAKTIVITTNQIPDRWYKNVYFEAFIRRVSRWVIMPEWGETETYEDYTSAVARMVNNTTRF